MPWKVSTPVSSREEFIALASQDNVNMRRLCQAFGISAKTGYKWLHRYDALGTDGLADQSRRPLHSPARTIQCVEDAILKVREHHESWGGRKIARWLKNHKPEIVLPSLSTITQILRRNGKIDPAESVKHQPWQRFEAAEPNNLWQMDFKGHFPMLAGGRCHPLTLVDDHSRFSPGLYACADEQDPSTRGPLIASFRLYGLPGVILVDNGSPWGSYITECRVTRFAAWLIRLGITVSHCRPHHPQTKGKNERFNRTLKTELLAGTMFHDLSECQRQFDRWLCLYNTERPHEALNMDVPAQHYRPSDREYPEVLPPVLYESTDRVRKVQQDGSISFQNKEYSISKGLIGEHVALRPSEDTDGLVDVFYCHQRILTINLRQA